MAIKQLNPYLMFNGTAAKAIAHYEKALGAKTEGLMRYGDIPGGDQKPSPDKADLVIHALLHVGAGVVMVSDCTPDQPAITGNNVNVTLDFDDLADMTRRFDALAQGGRVLVALHDTFWGATFGVVVDPFGISWMFNCQKK
ncbi:glyoxalase/bleomycin resistance/extradiol dioxygenase family protein [Myxococcota bacterium]|nr:glyoxalase/bleomycin resistance/extradiol dioxygenase family protein [Myxococcota bacterium]